MLRCGLCAVMAALLGVSCKFASAPVSSVCAEELGSASATGQQDAGLPTTDGEAGICGSCLRPLTCGRVQNPAIVSVAGLAASKRNSRTFYLHNASLDLPRFFAMEDTGADRGTFEVTGASNIAWAGLAVGPCPGGSCIFLADIGDPHLLRGQYTIYRVAEPTTLVGGLAGGVTSVTADAFPFTYPDGSHDAATLLVHPSTGAVTIVTLESDGVSTRAYELPKALPGQQVTATPRGLVGHLGLDDAVFGGSVAPDGSAVLLNTTAGVQAFAISPPDALGPLAAAFQNVPCSVVEQTDGQAIAWMETSSGFLSVDSGSSAALSYVFCGAR